MALSRKVVIGNPSVSSTNCAKDLRLSGSRYEARSQFLDLCFPTLQLGNGREFLSNEFDSQSRCGKLLVYFDCRRFDLVAETLEAVA